MYTYSKAHYIMSSNIKYYIFCQLLYWHIFVTHTVTRSKKKKLRDILRPYGAQLSVPPLLMVPKHYPWLLQVTVTDTVHRTTIDTDNSKRSTHLIRRNKGQTGPNGSMWNGIFNRVHKPGVLYSKKVTQTPAPAQTEDEEQAAGASGVREPA